MHRQEAIEYKLFMKAKGTLEQPLLSARCVRLWSGLEDKTVSADKSQSKDKDISL